MIQANRNFYHDEILSHAAALEIDVEVLEIAHSDALRRRLEKKFARPGPEPLWKRLTNKSGQKKKGGWNQLGEFFGGQPVYFFLEWDDDPRFYRLNDGAALNHLLAECSSFEVYVTDQNLLNLHCFNQFDVLIRARYPKGLLH